MFRKMQKFIHLFFTLSIVLQYVQGMRTFKYVFLLFLVCNLLFCEIKQVKYHLEEKIKVFCCLSQPFSYSIQNYFMINPGASNTFHDSTKLQLLQRNMPLTTNTFYFQKLQTYRTYSSFACLDELKPNNEAFRLIVHCNSNFVLCKNILMLAIPIKRLKLIIPASRK